MARVRPLALSALAGLMLVGAGCGEQRIQVTAAQDPVLREGAEIFYQRCSGCHTLDAAAAQGSKPARERGSGERTNGPNLNVRQEEVDDVLYAIRNGGFSGAIMPSNIVTGEEAEKVARFVARYAGSTRDRGPGVDQGSPTQGTTPREAQEDFAQ